MFRIILKSLREEKNLTQADLGKILGKQQSAVGMWESGKSYPDYLTLLELARFFDVSVDYLAGKSNERKTGPSEEGAVFDDFTYAMYDQAKELSEEEKKMLLDMATMLKRKKNEGT